MKKLLTLLLIIIVSGFIGWQRRGINRVVITDMTREGKYRSVKYIQGGKEWAQDYMTEQEYLNLINQ